VNRKRRTRQHVIADLSFNHIERFIFRCTYSAERIRSDYGIDLSIFTYDSNGAIENGSIGVQLKATDSIKLNKDGSEIHFSVETSYLESWLDEPMPVMLVVYAAKNDVAYWLYVQKYFESIPAFDLAQMGSTVTVHISIADIVNEEAVTQFAAFKQTILDQVQGVIRHA
jgi:hypothetical protein